MQVSVEKSSGLERKVRVEVPAEEIDSQIDKRLQDLNGRVKLKGFRPGRIPMKVLEQRYGGQVRDEVLSEVIQNSLQEALQGENLRPAVTPRVDADPRDRGQALTFTAEFEVFPELDAIDVSKFKLAKPSAEVGDDDIDDMLETLRLQRREWTPVERAVSDDDMVLLEYFAEYDDGRYPSIGRERVGTIVGSGALSAAFEKALGGLSGEDDHEFELTFEDDFRVEELAGKKCKVTAKLVRVSEAALPELTDEFAQAFGIENVDSLRNEVRANLERELAQGITARIKEQVVDALIDSQKDLELPEASVTREAEGMRTQAQEKLGEGREPPPVEEFMDVARRRVAAGVLLNEVARQNDIKADQQRIMATIQSIASTYEEPEKVAQMYASDPNLLGQVHSMVMEDQVVDWVAENAQVSEEKTTFKGVMNPEES